MTRALALTVACSMSAINFSCNVKKVEKNGADNVQITLTGKWLPYDFHE